MQLKTKLRKKLSNSRVYQIHKAKKFLNNNIIEEINIKQGPNIKLNFIGQINKEDIKKTNFKNIDEIQNSLVLTNGNFDKIEKNNTIFLGTFKNKIVKINTLENKKIYYISYEPSEKFELELKRIVTRIYASKILNADYIIVYIKPKNSNSIWKIKNKIINKQLLNLGVNHLIYSFKDLKTLSYYNRKKDNCSEKIYISLDNYNKDVCSFCYSRIDLNCLNNNEEYYYLVNNQKMS